MPRLRFKGSEFREVQSELRVKGCHGRLLTTSYGFRGTPGPQTKTFTAGPRVVRKNRKAHRGDAEVSQRAQRKRRLSNSYSGRSMILTSRRENLDL
jgi:hypothetical protein